VFEVLKKANSEASEINSILNEVKNDKANYSPLKRQFEKEMN
jgi:hypothetical protein